MSNCGACSRTHIIPSRLYTPVTSRSATPVTPPLVFGLFAFVSPRAVARLQWSKRQDDRAAKVRHKLSVLQFQREHRNEMYGDKYSGDDRQRLQRSWMHYVILAHRQVLMETNMQVRREEERGGHVYSVVVRWCSAWINQP